MRHLRRSGFFCRYAKAAKEFLDNNDCTSDFFLAAYPILSLDQNRGVLPDGLTKGVKIQAVRWFQFNRTTRDVRSTASSLLLMITYIGMKDRWFDRVDASPLGRLLGREAP